LKKCEPASVPSLKGLDSFGRNLPGTPVPGFPMPPLRGWGVSVPLAAWWRKQKSWFFSSCGGSE
jgi:hypothetical protein